LVAFIPVSDLAVARSFYEGTLGLQVTDENPFALVLNAAGTMLRVTQVSDLKPQPFRELLDVRDRGRCPCGHTQVLVDRRLAEVESEIEQLLAVRKQLLVLKKRNADRMDATPEEWSCAIDVEKGGGT
jgi:hypothetical protein